VQEPQYRSGSRRIRPFAQSAGVNARGCSRRLQRALTDLGADLPYAQVMDKMVEHYGIVIAESTIRRITLHHAQEIQRRSKGQPQGLPKAVAAQQTFIVEMDGTMVPTVRNDAAQGDRRKGKSVQWQEAKVSLAHVQGSKEISYAATLLGDVDTAGKQLRACAKRAGFGKGHRVHGVGDGARWIAHQVKQRFGSQGSYLLDFYHVCDYLVAAGHAIEIDPAARQTWCARQKDRLKARGLEFLLDELQTRLEPSQTTDEEAPVRRCHRYLSQRQDQLDYEGAIRNDLPIGSGEIESAHRYLIQKRLKLPGSWWLAANAENMLALRVCRANAEWPSYWATEYRYAA
jgi:hypothetical protein